MIAHTLGNPFDLKAVKEFCDKYNLFLIEDCCDAVGSKYDGKMVGFSNCKFLSSTSYNYGRRWRSSNK